jgi:hypothetical protein
MEKNILALDDEQRYNDVNFSFTLKRSELPMLLRGATLAFWISMMTSIFGQVTHSALTSEALVVETSADAQQAFQCKINEKGMFAVILHLTNTSTTQRFSFQRAAVVVKTEFDATITSLEGRRAYDRMMWKVGSGPAFAEAAIIRTISESSRKKKLKQSLLAKALNETVELGPEQDIEGAVFFERPADIKTLRYSTLVIEEIVDLTTDQRFSISMPFAKSQ